MDVAEYHKLAAVEDRMWYFRALHRHIDAELSRRLGATPAKVLDAGCGTGGLITRLAAAHPTWSWTGVDVSDVALAYARERVGALGRKVEIVPGSVTALPFPAASFDAIVSADVLYHVEADETALGEFARVLRPGGVVVLNVPAYRWLWSYHDVAVQSCRRYGRRELIAKVSRAGLRMQRATFWNTLPFPLVVARRKLLPAPASGSDVRLFPRPIEAAFSGAMALERAWLRVMGRLPFGSSILAVAVKIH